MVGPSRASSHRLVLAAVTVHVVLAVVPVLAALIIALPLGYLVFRTGKGANPILAVLGVIYSIPSLALFVALPVLLGTREDAADVVRAVEKVWEHRAELIEQPVTV